MFANILGDTMEVYIDDMLVKSLIAKQCLDHLCLAFEVLKKYNMNLNPTKFLFSVSLGKFLGYMVTQWGHRSQPKSDPIYDGHLVSYLHQGFPMPCQKSGCFQLVHLQIIREVSPRLRDSTQVQVLRMDYGCKEALQNLKKHFTSPPLLSKPKDDE